ncbi:MAG: hypothetical protein IT424_15375 [Pirellulales bacterium]|nr:hypothetical protein [Pirellulales bacterium]
MNRIALAAVALGCSTLASAARAEFGYVAYEPAATCCKSPVVVTSYYAPAPCAVYSGPVVGWTRYRPILGGVVTRLRYATYDAPPAYYAPPW